MRHATYNSIEEEDKSILAIGANGKFIVRKPRWLIVSLAGFLFWSALIAAAKQVWQWL